MTESDRITLWLRQWQGGDASARDQVFTVVHEYLNLMAAQIFVRERLGHTLEPNALVNELYLRLFRNQHHSYRDRSHFFAIAAQTMRRILIDYARAEIAGKRGGRQQRVSLSDVDGLPQPTDIEDVLALDAALTRLAVLDQRAAQVVELRFFGGLQEDEVAEALGISVITVKRDWKSARAWLSSQLRQE
ncbi:MAG TPA: ECF-type sigma factor [Bryobacteraceae bacterium]|nr:ECF-type sigma factor [Bryobacteraceae bacterium]